MFTTHWLYLSPGGNNWHRTFTSKNKNNQNLILWQIVYYDCHYQIMDNIGFYNRLV